MPDCGNDGPGALPFSPAEALQFAEDACLSAGANSAMASSLARATLAAETSGNVIVGFRHLPDYLSALKRGAIDGSATPVVSSTSPTAISVDARCGIAQLGYDQAFEQLVRTTRLYGTGIFLQRNSYTSGELGYYVRRLAERGLVALAATNGPAVVAPSGVTVPVYCTNPLAFAVPTEGEPPLVIDQSSSETALVKINRAAELGELLPENWAVDAQGSPTRDPVAALQGHLLTFGGARGANIALLVEMLAAGLTGAKWSLDSPSFQDGPASPGTGLFIFTIAPQYGVRDFLVRVRAQLTRLSGLGIYLPGKATDGRHTRQIAIPKPVVDRICDISGLAKPR